MAEVTRGIINGPNKLLVMFCLFSGDASNQTLLDFTVKVGDRTFVESLYIRGAEWEDGSGERWNLIGFADNSQVHIYYDFRTRRGSITFGKGT